MKRSLLLVLFVCMVCRCWAQNYVTLGDSCFDAKNYVEAAKNYDLFLDKVEGRSNMIAYRSARSWSMAGDSERALEAVRKYVSNNYINEYYTFSDKLINDKAFDLLKNKPEWKGIIAEVMEREQAYKKKQQLKLDSILNYQEKLEKQGMFYRLKLGHGSGRSVYENIRSYNNYPKIKDQLISFQFKFNDTLHNSFLIVLPKNYNEKRKYPLLFFLHGAVKMNTGYSDYSDEMDTAGWNRFYTKYASINQVIMVYPRGNREYNWMSPEKGFYMLPAILTQVKKIVDTDDDRVFISGHSNGATGSFSYALKQPSPFAGFYGFNTRPQVATGGTYIGNLLNRSFFNISTDQDYYYPPAAHDSLSHLMKLLGVDYQDHRYNGFPHWFPAFPESEPAFSLAFVHLILTSTNGWFWIKKIRLYHEIRH
jgi:predicted esterase